MSCLCGDLGCPSCGPAQGSSLSSEAAFDYVHERLVEFLSFSGEVAATESDAPFSVDWHTESGRLLVVDSITVPDHGKFIDKLLDDGNEEGLVRLTSLVLDLMKEAVDAARSEDAASWAELAQAQEAEAQLNGEPPADLVHFDVCPPCHDTSVLSDFNAELEDRLERRAGPSILPDPDEDNDWGHYHIKRDEEE